MPNLRSKATTTFHRYIVHEDIPGRLRVVSTATLSPLPSLQVPASHLILYVDIVTMDVD